MKTQMSYTHSALIVEDEPDICYLLNNILRQKAIHAQLAGSVAEAEKALTKLKPTLIFLDNHLPDGLGVDQVDKFRKKVPNSRIIMITAHDNASDREKALKKGVDFFISKPFDRDTILKTLEKINSTNGV